MFWKSPALFGHADHCWRGGDVLRLRHTLSPTLLGQIPANYLHLPIALVANSARIVATGLMYQFGFGESAQQFFHDFAGWVDPLRHCSGIFLLYLDRLFVTYQPVDPAGMTKAMIKKWMRPIDER
jgi:exosortase/archaeosortase family protein